MPERRRHPRHRATFPIQIDTAQKKQRLGVARNASVNGVLIGTGSRFDAGERVSLALQFHGEAQQWRVSGRIVRVASDRTSDWFSRILAVEFDQALPEIEALLDQTEREQAELRN
jgi:Tfp pilus assembly protein PilZ